MANENRFENVYWIGGAGCSGKSTVADILARRYDIEIYRGDSWHQHLDRADPEKHPILTRVRNVEKRKSAEGEGWLNPPQTLLEMAKGLYTEYFPFFLQDLASYPSATRVLIEGAQLLPELCDKVATPDRVIYLNATEEFIRERNNSRPIEATLVEDYEDRETANANRIGMMILIAKYTDDFARELGFRSITVDGTRTPVEIAQIVANHFRFANP